MLHSEKKIRLITLILGTIAGYCDTVTFTSANGLLSAHITGNFILFAGRLIRTSDLISWVRLLAFPVFVLSVITGGWIARRPQPRRTLLLIEGLVLCIAGMTAFLLKLNNPLYYDTFMYPIALAIVFAMGLQNTYGKLFTADVYGPTTAMTGNVTQWAIDMGRMIKGLQKPTAGLENRKDPQTIDSFKKQSLLITAFLIGCLAGALVSRFVGLGAVLLAGIALLITPGPSGPAQTKN
jgi:uncharacterized membrane protein YoaK (UPF0700 family)